MGCGVDHPIQFGRKAGANDARFAQLGRGIVGDGSLDESGRIGAGIKLVEEATQGVGG